VGAPHIRQRLWFVGHPDEPGRQARDGVAVGNGPRSEQPAHSGSYGLMADALPAGRPERWSSAGDGSSAGSGGTGGRADSECDGGWADEPQREAEGRTLDGRPDPWRCELLPCTDGKARPVEPGTFPLAHGIPGRVGRLRAYGNAIVPQCAAEFIRAAMGK
jgi:DNA (cytosine-5)-methyltransferase 1